MAPDTTYENDATIICSKANFNDLKKSFANLIVMKGNDLGKRFKIKRDSLIIGRTSSADIMLKDKQECRSTLC